MLAITNADRLKDKQADKVMARLEKLAHSDFRDFALLASLQAQQAFDSGGVTDREMCAMSGGAELHEKLGRLLGELRLNRLRKAQAFLERLAGKALRNLELTSLNIPA